MQNRRFSGLKSTSNESKVFTIRIDGPQHQAVSSLPKCSHLDIGQQVIKGTRVDNYGTWVC